MDEEEQVESQQCTVEPCTIQRGWGYLWVTKISPGEMFHYNV